MWVGLGSGSLKVTNTILIVILTAIDHNKVMLMKPSSIVNGISTIC